MCEVCMHVCVCVCVFVLCMGEGVYVYLSAFIMLYNLYIYFILNVNMLHLAIYTVVYYVKGPQPQAVLHWGPKPIILNFL